MLITNPRRIRDALGGLVSDGDSTIATLVQAVTNAIGEFGALSVEDLTRADFASLRNGDELDAFVRRVVETLNQAATATGTRLRAHMSEGTGPGRRWVWFDAVPACKDADFRSIIGPDGEAIFNWSGPTITACAIPSKADITVVGDQSGRMMAVISGARAEHRPEVREAEGLRRSVRAIKVCDDGRYALGVDEGGQVQMLDTVAARTLWMNEGWDVASITPDGSSAVLAMSDGTDAIVRVVSGRRGLVRSDLRLPGAERIDACAILSSDEFAVAGVFGGERKVVRTFATHPEGIAVARYRGVAQGLALPVDGSPVVVLSRAEVLRGLAKLKPLGSMRGPMLSGALETTAKASALTSGGDLVMLAREGGCIELWETVADAKVWSHLFHAGDSAYSITSCALSPLGRRLALNLGDEVRLYRPIIDAS